MLCALLLFTITLALCISEILIIIKNDETYDDDDISGRERDGSYYSYNYIKTHPYTYHLGSNKNKTYKKRKMNKWAEEFDFN